MFLYFHKLHEFCRYISDLKILKDAQTSEKVKTGAKNFSCTC